MKKKAKSRSLSIEDARRIFGADDPVSIGLPLNDPVTVRALSTIVQDRLVSGGGRPSDPSWSVVKKIPMRANTWEQLELAAAKLQERQIRVSAGQIAAIVLERGITVTIGASIMHKESPSRGGAAYSTFSPEIERGATRGRAAMQAHPLWS